jgi:hypothetical protein
MLFLLPQEAGQSHSFLLSLLPNPDSEASEIFRAKKAQNRNKNPKESLKINTNTKIRK